MTSKPPADTAEPSASVRGKRVRAAKKVKRFGRHLKDKWIYYAIVAFYAVAILILLWVHICFSSTSSDAVRNAYYFLILIGAGIATFISVWRGRQSDQQIKQSDQQIGQFERQLKNSRFEKAVDMATDPTSPDRRGIGFRVLWYMFFSSEEKFDAMREEDIAVLVPLATHNFRLREIEQQKDFKKLYVKSRRSYDGRSSSDMFDETHVPTINNFSLNMWKELTRKIWIRFNNSPINAIYAPQAKHGTTLNYIFSGMNLRGLQFLVMDDDGKMLSPTKYIRPNFKKSCFLLGDMREAVVSYVDFSESHLCRVNRLNYDEVCNMKCIGTIFDSSNLIECNFRGTDFKDASFDDTNISGSNFSQTNLTPKQFKTAYWISPNTPKFPEGWDDNFVNSLARDAQEVEGEAAP